MVGGCHERGGDGFSNKIDLTYVFPINSQININKYYLFSEKFNEILTLK